MPYLGGLAVFAGVVVGAMGRSARRPGPVGRRPGGRGQRRPLRPSGAVAARGPAGRGSRHRRHPAGPPPGLDRCAARHGSQCRLDQRLQPARRPRHAVRRGRGCRRRRVRRRHPWPCPSPGRLPDRGPGRVPLVQPSSGPHLSGGRRLLPARGVHDRAPHLRLGRRRRQCDRRARSGPAGRSGGRGGVRHRATASQRPFAPDRRPRPSLRPPRGERMVPHGSQCGLHRRRGGGGGGDRGGGGRPCLHDRGPGNRPGGGGWPFSVAPPLSAD